MEPVRLEIAPEVNLDYVRSDKFKTGTLSVQLITPINEKTASFGALLPSVLRRGTMPHPDMRSLSTALDLLYGSSIGCTVRKKGENQCIGFAADFIDDAFTPHGERLLEPVAELMGEMLLEPLTRLYAVAGAVFTDLRFRPGMPFEDLEILPRLFAKASLVAVSDGVTYGYRRYAESTEGGHLELLKSAMFEVLSSGIAVAEERHGYRSPTADRLTVGYAMQAAKMLEGAAAPGVAREPGFDRAYHRFMARNLRALLGSADLSRTYKLALLVSVAWPAAFVTGFRVARRLKSTVAPNLRRASTGAASPRRS